MDYTLYQVDAFTRERFRGNPAAVLPLAHWLPDEMLQAVAQENNLAETAYFVPQGDAFHLRWFTPVAEINLCGHATLASAWVLFHELGYGGDEITFHTLSGALRVRRKGERLSMDFPATPAREVEVPAGLVEAMGAAPKEIRKSRDWLLVYESEEAIARLEPDMAVLAKLAPVGVIATAPGSDCDFVSRFFAPAMGVPEDPVTGSAHCTLVPYWAEQSGKQEFFARQISARAGELWLRLDGDRVHLEGEGVLYLRGRIFL